MKDLVQSNVQSIWLDSSYSPLIDQLATLRRESKQIITIFDQFREQTICYVNQVMGKIASNMHRETANKLKLEEELKVVKESNCNMRSQVIQLREMIEQFVKGYTVEIDMKNKEISELRKQLGDGNDFDGHTRQESEFPHFNAIVNEFEQQNSRRISLDVIQEVSQYTASVGQTIRGSETGPNSVQCSSSFPMFSNDNDKTNRNEEWGEKEEEELSRISLSNKRQSQVSVDKKAKSFIKNFRKNIDEITVNEEKQGFFKESHENSIDDLNIGETAKINIPKNIKSPKNLESIKKNSGRIKTEGDSTQNNKQNQIKQMKEIKMTPQHRRNKSTSSRTGQDQSIVLSEFDKNQRNSKSHSRTCSKEKIKLASKIIDESHCLNNQKYTNKKVVALRPSVHLGGKMNLKKLARDVRVSLQDLKIWEGSRAREVKYQGEKKNGMRWGRGKLLYENGFQYEGSFVQNYRHGIGTVSLNGMVFYEGQWSLDELNGQGYIKSLKNYSQKCPKILSQASYCGQLLQNKPNGMGTLFLNQNQKFVSKFVHGVPVGQFTYYNHSDIQFGAWF